MIFTILGTLIILLGIYALVTNYIRSPETTYYQDTDPDMAGYTAKR